MWIEEILSFCSMKEIHAQWGQRFSELKLNSSWFYNYVFQYENKEVVTWVTDKIENVLKGRLYSIPTSSTSVKIQIMGKKICLRCKGKTLLGVVNKLLKVKIFCPITSNKLSRFWIFTEGEGDGIESRLSS